MTYQEVIDSVIRNFGHPTTFVSLNKNVYSLHDLFDVEELKKFLSYEKRDDWIVLCIRGKIVSEIYNNIDITSAEFNEIEEFLNSEYPLACPEKGEFIGYKKVCVTDTDGANCSAIATLYIPEDAKRSSAFGKKCRCSKAEVLSICVFSPIYIVEKGFSEAYSYYDSSFVYRVGETVEVNNFDNCRWRECSTGIHFFKDAYDAAMYCP